MRQRVGALHLVPVPIIDEPAGASTVGSAHRVLPPSTIEVARQARYFLAENARSARAFIKAIAHPQPIASLQIVQIGHEPDAASIDQWLAPLTDRDGRPAIDAVLLSEAGCPGVADPGATLVARAHTLGIKVVPWVGPSSILLALMAAGMNGQRFRFLGYLPQPSVALRDRLLAVQRDAQRGETQVFIETPYRNARLFETILKVCDRTLRLCLAIDLTGANQTIATRTIAQWLAMADDDRPALDRRATVFLLHAGPASAPAPA
ncbi:S-adenosylmethionine-dependent methyltransferase, YraL family [Burkholderiales bacterium]|nr:S-adenosylmethionine-dependent methyltransferase, YraL family [Burkholderiales bacterium]